MLIHLEAGRSRTIGPYSIKEKPMITRVAGSRQESKVYLATMFFIGFILVYGWSKWTSLTSILNWGRSAANWAIDGLGLFGLPMLGITIWALIVLVNIIPITLRGERHGKNFLLDKIKALASGYGFLGTLFGIGLAFLSFMDSGSSDMSMKTEVMGKFGIAFNSSIVGFTIALIMDHFKEDDIAQDKVRGEKA